MSGVSHGSVIMYSSTYSRSYFCRVAAESEAACPTNRQTAIAQLTQTLANPSSELTCGVVLVVGDHFRDGPEGVFLSQEELT